MIASKMYFTNGGGFKVPAVKYLLNTMDATKKYPLVVFLPGNGESGDGSDGSLSRLATNNNNANVLKFAEQFGFLVFMPQFVQAYNYIKIGDKVTQTWRPEWSGGNYVNDAIEWAKANMPVDPTKIILTGLSGGGGGCVDYITNSQAFADKISACIPVCATEQSGTPNWEAAKTVPTWFWHGDADATIHVGASIRQAAACNAKLTIIPGAGHSIWSTVYNTPELYKWALAQTSDIKPIPTEPFKPTHIIRNADGSSESVRIETL